MDTGLVVLFVLFYAGGAASLWIVIRAEVLRNKAWVHWAAVAYFFCTVAPLAVKVAGRAGLAGPVIQAVALGPGCLMFVPLFAVMVGNLFTSMSRRVMGDHRLVVSKTYDQAEAAEKRRDYEKAMSLYRQA
ncbi:MAG: hypothetical protein RDV41_14330, partial [Planctomycetota bacterium]|nr:hypothetical protein [Planctomycetota bacterium]